MKEILKIMAFKEMVWYLFSNISDFVYWLCELIPFVALKEALRYFT